MAEHEIPTVERDLEPIQQGQEWNKNLVFKKIVNGEETPKDISGWSVSLIIKEDIETDDADAEIDKTYSDFVTSRDGKAQISLDKTDTVSLSEGAKRYEISVSDGSDSYSVFHGEVYILTGDGTYFKVS